MKMRQNTGFTLIEVMIVVAISAMLATIIVIGQGAFMDRSRFNDAMDTLHSRLNQTRREVYAVVNGNTGFDCDGNSSEVGTDTDCVLFGKAVQFNGTNFTTRTLTATSEGEGFTDQELEDIQDIPSLEVENELKWGVEFTDSTSGAATDPDTIVFARNFQTGALETFTMSSSQVEDPAAYTESARSQATFEFSSHDNSSLGRIHVNETPNTLRRSFDL